MERTLTKELIAGYIRELEEDEKSRVTIEKYQRDIYKFYHFLEEEKRFSKKEILAFKSDLISRYTAVSVNSMLSAVNGLFRHLEWNELHLHRIKTQKKVFCQPEKELSRKEYTRLLNEAKKKKDKRLYFIMLTLCATGIRVSELPYITVQALVGGQASVMCKNKSRTILIPRQLRQYLMDYVKEQGIRKGPVFVSNSGRAVDRSNIWRGMKRLCKRAMVSPQKVFPHNLRHLFARTYYRQEKDVIRLADILGHSSVDTTRMYTISTGSEHEQRMHSLGLII